MASTSTDLLARRDSLEWLCCTNQQTIQSLLFVGLRRPCKQSPLSTKVVERNLTPGVSSGGDVWHLHIDHIVHPVLAFSQRSRYPSIF